MKRFALAAMTAALMSSGAYAADVYSKGSLKDTEVAVEASRTWTGLWLGAFGGYSMNNTELSLNSFHDNGDKSLNKGRLDGLGGEGLFGEVQAGYDRQIGRLVVGCYGGVNFSGAETEASGKGASLKIEEDIAYLAACRFGALLNKDTLVYVAGGYRWQDVDITVTDGASKTFTEDFDGFLGEVGLETRISGGLFGRLAARYTAFDDKNWSDRAGAEDNCWNELNADPGKLEIMAGITYKFGTGERGFFGD